MQIIYQDLSLFPNLTVAENIAFRHHVETPVRLANRNVMRKQAQAVMDRLKLDELVGTLPIATPTGGDLPRAGGGRAAGRDGRADRVLEPPGGRGPSGCGHELKRQKIASLFVSHRLDEVMDIAERVTVMRTGEILEPIQ